MDTKSAKKICSVCGNKCGIFTFTIKDNAKCCSKCMIKYAKQKDVKKAGALRDVSTEDIQSTLKIEQNSNTSSVYDTTYSTSKKRSENKIVIITISIVIAAIILGVVLGFALSDSISTHEYHSENVAVFKEVFGEDIARDIVLAIEKTGVIGDSQKLSVEDIYPDKNNEYDIYTGITLRLVLFSEHFKLYTYEKEYNSQTAILLYDSADISTLRTLTKAEYDSIKESQRRYIVENTIDILPSIGVLLHNQYGKSQFSFTIKNIGQDKIDNITMKITPGFVGYQSDRNVGTYTTYDALAPGKSKEYTLTKTDWGDYDLFYITEVVVYFSDGTAIKFNKYDCQFL